MTHFHFQILRGLGHMGINSRGLQENLLIVVKFGIYTLNIHNTQMTSFIPGTLMISYRILSKNWASFY